MAMTLKPELEERIQQKLHEGYASVDDVIASALDRLEEANCGLTLTEFQAKIDVGWEAAERGDTISSKDFEAGMDEWRAKVNARL